ncbi:putative MFS-type transporter -like protein [Dinothrombium tinctorium]|uniref:Putative MFS-type transporter-like protein n=1 Tax=Dinothrombium tinctorium TaxID=1965070 RepID=A0A3S4QPN3_9ACAR|nr:putative MFS-type transporter -like protein [Dinothrombium tinctorium]RWS07120.1 putative MFS-type transporter -like protein [Dinothrombium tinctorium]RWS08440.1 putative MFS-type transporter -like protein [Dinothrombium tinctorium]
MNDSNTHFVHYNRRYIILVLLGLFTATNFYQHYEFSAITNVVAKFYEIDRTDVNWTSLLYNIGSVVMFYPIMKCIEKFGFQVTMTLVTFCEALGTCIKCLALRRGYYGLLLFGQSFSAFVTICQPSLSALFGANWFKSEHVAAVIGLSSVFLNFGAAFAFVTPTLFAQLTIRSEIKNGLTIISIVLALITSATFVLTVLVVREKPPTPPSLAQKNINYILLTIIFSMIITLSQTTAVILNQSILAVFPNGNRIITIAGILSLIPGIPSSLLTGFICKRFRNLWLKCELLIYVSIFFAGFFFSGVYVISMDFVVEVTYPYSEGVTVNLTTLLGCIPSILCLPIISSLIEKQGAPTANLVLICED